MQKAVTTLVCALLLSGCAPIISGTMNASASPELVRSKTAEHFGVSPARVRVSKYEKGLLGTAYRARVNGTLFNCTYYYGAVTCKRPGG